MFTDGAPGYLLLSSIIYLIAVLFFQRKKNLIDSNISKSPNHLINNPTQIFKFILIIIRNMFGFSFMAPALIIFSLMNLMTYL